MPGRGGAGNWEAVQQAKERAKTEVEANQAPEAPIVLADPSVRREQREKAYTGRGGSGNRYSPKELHKNGTFQDTVLGSTGTSAFDTAAGWSAMLSSTQAKGSDVVRKFGRGGAGNMIYDVTEDEERVIRKMQEELKGKELRQHIEENVNATLVEPPKAKLAGPEPWS